MRSSAASDWYKRQVQKQTAFGTVYLTRPHCFFVVTVIWKYNKLSSMAGLPVLLFGF